MSGNAERMQAVRKAINGDRLEPRIAEDNLVRTMSGRVTVVGGLNVGRDQAAQFWNRLQKGKCLFVSPLVGIVTVPYFAGGHSASADFIAEGAGNLFAEPLGESLEQIANVFPHIGPMQVAALVIARERGFP